MVRAQDTEAECFLWNENLVCDIHPLVYVSILDAYARRGESETGHGKQERVIGTLMGLVSEGNVVEIVDCFQLVHKDSDKVVRMDIPHHKQLVKLRGSVHPKEVVVGWFSCGEKTTIDEHTVSIQNFYQTQPTESHFSPTPVLPNPLYLQIDATIRPTEKPIGVKLYTAPAAPVICSNLMQFHPVRIAKSSLLDTETKTIMDMTLETKILEAERDDGVRIPVRFQESFGSNTEYLKELLLKAKEYVGEVRAGKVAGNPEVGRALSAVLAEGDEADEKLQAALKGGVKDTMMVLYLANLAKTQIHLAEKVTQILSNTQDN